MRLKSLIGIILWGGMLVSCGPDNRVVLAEKLMAEKGDRQCHSSDE